MPYQHEDLCPRHESVQKYIAAGSCVYCQLILAAVAAERSRQFRDPFENQTTVEGER